MFSDHFNVLILKIILKKKKIILMYFRMKNNHNHTPKHAQLAMSPGSRLFYGFWDV